ncbi:MAG TPA: glycoside hydrolase family 99-like domain-containing protein [Casimicrobiaceae bacterium]|nr:glycoside hydrolase family 99-like domain-containing protein [Casimicrobiaceae bacterium]
MTRDDAPVRALAFYLPQYHRIPENDAWWGEGFTEWTNVRRAVPQFPGHEQPKAPGELGWYDLTDPAVADAQAALARAHGIFGFCYYFYWFNGRRLLERPLEDMLARGTPDFPFCVCWANENWTRRWDGGDDQILMEQHYGPDDSARVFDAFLRLFRDPRYVRVSGRPVLLVYKATLIPEIAATAAMWRTQAREAGEEAPYLIACETAGLTADMRAAFDAVVEFPPHGHRAVWMNAQVAGLAPDFTGIVTSYRAQVIQSLRRDADAHRTLRCVFPTWDNTARRGTRGTVFAGSSPELFGWWVERMTVDTRRRLAGDERLLFVNAWNEWAEGCCLEPDARYGRQYLEAFRDGLAQGSRANVASLDRPSWRAVERDTAAAVTAGEVVVERFGTPPERGTAGVSVVMPVYNHARFVERALASIAAQTVLPRELVVVDDGSGDGSAAIVERFARSAPFPVTLARQRNRGAHVAINRGLALSACDTLALLNSDDAFAPGRLAQLSSALGPARELAWSEVSFVGEDDAPATGPAIDTLVSSIRAARESGDRVAALTRTNLAVSSGNLVFRRSLLDATGGFAALEVCHDWDFVLAASAVTDIAVLPEPLYRYRVHGANTFVSRHLAGQVEVERVLGRFLARIGEHPALDEDGRMRLRAALADRGLAHLWPE